MSICPSSTLRSRQDNDQVDKTYLNDGHGFWKRVAALLAWCAGGASVHFTSVFFVTTISPRSPSSSFVCVPFIAFASDVIAVGDRVRVRKVGMLIPRVELSLV